MYNVITIFILILSLQVQLLKKNFFTWPPCNVYITLNTGRKLKLKTSYQS